MELTVGGRAYHLRQGWVEVLELSHGSRFDVKVENVKADQIWVRSMELVDGAYQPGSESDLVARLLADDEYSLRARVPNDDEHVRAILEYKEWSGEDLDDECVYVRPREKHTTVYGEKEFQREWRLHFMLRPGMLLPFRVTVAGMAANYSHKDPTNETCLINSKSQVDVNWVSIIERLVRLGLRATGPRKEHQCVVTR